jgi:hypothetical protein
MLASPGPVHVGETLTPIVAKQSPDPEKFRLTPPVTDAAQHGNAYTPPRRGQRPPCVADSMRLSAVTSVCVIAGKRRLEPGEQEHGDNDSTERGPGGQQEDHDMVHDVPSARDSTYSNP